MLAVNTSEVVCAFAHVPYVKGNKVGEMDQGWAFQIVATKSYLVIKLNDVWYHYCEVDNASFKNITTANSVGSYYNQNFPLHGAVHGPFDCRDHPVPTFPGASGRCHSGERQRPHRTRGRLARFFGGVLFPNLAAKSSRLSFMLRFRAAARKSWKRSAFGSVSTFATAFAIWDYPAI